MEDHLATANEMMANQSTAANGLSAVRSGVAGIRERTVHSTTAPGTVAEIVVVPAHRQS